ncbi:MAG: AMP-binding protein [Planctomycetota bacterium]|jgi:long-chain-fatty-acid--[acyl-carrier-protein] ligase
MIVRFLMIVAKFLLWLRYRITVRGLDKVLAGGREGILFLPNHPALIDPIIMVTRLYRRFRIRALADNRQVDRFLIRRVAAWIDVLPIPDMTAVNQASAERVQAAMAECLAALQRGENLLLYPAGHTYRKHLEDLGGSSAVETILKRLPNVRVVLVRITGLWGSLFGWASGHEPNVGRTLGRGTLWLLASGVFFAPRRRVSIEFVEPDDLPRDADRNTLNRTLEEFYNHDAPPNTYVPYSIWHRGPARQVPEPPAVDVQGDPSAVPGTTRQLVQEYLRELTGINDFNDDTRLAHDMGMDSLAGLELATWLQQEFGFIPPDLTALRTVGDVMLAACGEAVSTGPVRLKPVPKRWFGKTIEPLCPEGIMDMSVPQVILAQARRAPGRAIMADQTSGVRTYRDLITGVFVLRGMLEALPGEYVGIMLPASAAAGSIYAATLFADKIPVMVNWTLGPRNLQASLNSLGVQTILTAKVLVAQIESSGIDLSAVAERFVYLEDLAASLSRRAKLMAFLRAQFSWRALDKLAIDPSRPAVVLFTSGSESLPKAVPLSHRNVLTNVHDITECFALSATDSILGILPPFHSFGLISAIFLPLAFGVRVACYPNPTDGVALGRMIEAYRASLLVGTPTFLHGIVRASEAERLTSLRLVVSGAEKCPPRVYEAVAAKCPQTVILEGYGVTECSPVISANREEDHIPETIGKVMGSLDYALRHPDTHQPVERGQTGELLVRGPSVFDGYLNYSGPPPFVEFDGKQWYHTGDLVSEDERGTLTFVGRLKRFVKLGGEMISLPAVEAVLEPHYRSEADDTPVVAVVATPDEERPELVLFATKDVDRDSANRAIRHGGLSGLHNVRRVIRVDHLPLLGTGKTDYRELTRRLADS